MENNYPQPVPRVIQKNGFQSNANNNDQNYSDGQNSIDPSGFVPCPNCNR